VSSGKQREHVRSSSRVHFVGLTPSEPSSPAADNKTTTTTPTTPTTPVPASYYNGQLYHHQQHEQDEIAGANNIDTVRGMQVMSAGGVSGTVRRTLYSPRYTSDGQLKHYLTTTTNAILSVPHNND